MILLRAPTGRSVYAPGDEQLSAAARGRSVRTPGSSRPTRQTARRARVATCWPRERNKLQRRERALGRAEAVMDKPRNRLSRVWPARAGARRAGARRRTPKTVRWLRPIRLGIGASNCGTRSAPSSNSCAEPSRSCARSSIRRRSRSEAVDSVSRTQARHSGSSTKPGRGAAVAFGGRCENVSCCRAQRVRHRVARSVPRRVGR